MDKRLAFTIGMAARAARATARLTQADVAERVGIATEVYGRLERGQMLPSVLTLCKLCDVLQVSADVLLGRQAGEAPRLTAAEVPQPFGQSGEWRLLQRRLRGLNRRGVKLLSRLAFELGRHGAS